MRSALLSLAVLCLVGCGKVQQQQSKASTKAYGEIYTIYPSSDSSWSYSVYLPSEYGTERKCPVIFAFDPHGSGITPVEILKPTAEKAQYIIIGSNSIKNGIANPQLELQRLWDDVISRFIVNHDRIYAIGFSGGGRIASYFGLTNPSVKSIVSAGAGLTNLPPGREIGFSFMGISGTRDFNYTEVLQSYQLLNQSNVSATYLLFSGGHNWFPESIVEDIFLFFETDAFNRKQIKKNKQIDNLFTASLSKIKELSLSQQTDIYLSRLNFIQYISSTLKTYAEYKDQINQLSDSKEFSTYQNIYQTNRKLEDKLQQAYNNNYPSKEIDWWKNEVNQLNARINSDSDTLKKNMYSRVKAFISMASYAHLYKELESKNVAYAKKLLEIYRLTDAKNPDYYFGMAWYLSLTGNKKTGLQYIDSAKNAGFSNVPQIKKIGLF